MRNELLNLVPERYLCPFCGEWHEWEYCQTLGDSGFYNRHCFACDNRYDSEEEYEIFLDNSDNTLRIGINGICKDDYEDYEEYIDISEIAQSNEKPIVTFKIEYTSDSIISKTKCKGCKYADECNLHKMCKKGGSREFEIELGFEFDEEEYFKIVERKSSTKNKKSSKRKTTNTTAKEQNNMFNNMMNLNFEFGMITDDDIKSTFMGIAVRANNSWRIYDKKENAITDIGDMQLGNLPLFAMPTMKLEVGDLIRTEDGYSYIKEIKDGVTKALAVDTGELKSVIPVKNILGFNCYTKICSIVEELDFEGEMDEDSMLMMSMMFGNYGEDNGQMGQILPLLCVKGMFKGDFDLKKIILFTIIKNAQESGEDNPMLQILPFVIFKDSLGGFENANMKRLVMLSMMSNCQGGNQNAMNQLIPILFLKKGFGDADSDMMKVLIMSAITSGANVFGGNNPIITYLMLKEFGIGEEKEKAISSGNEEIKNEIQNNPIVNDGESE